MKKIAILTNGGRAFSSSRFRGWWLEDFNPVRFKAYAPGDVLDGIDQCDVVIFQKRQGEADIQRALRYKAEGRIILYDITEPMWWFEPDGTRAMIQIADAVTTSSPALSQVTRDAPEAKAVITIPDRMLSSFHPTVADHGERERVRFVWFGATDNRVALTGALPLLTYLSYRVPLELRIIDGAPHRRLDISNPERATVVHVPWALETFHAQLVSCDIAILPPYPGPWGALKSNNKAVTAWWAGLPVVSGFDLDEMAYYALSAEHRAGDGKRNRMVAEQEYGIEKSAAQWLELVAAIEEGREAKLPQAIHPLDEVERSDGSGIESQSPFHRATAAVGRLTS